MFRLATSLIAILILAPYASNAQQSEAPLYHDGDGWRVKSETVRVPGVSVAGPQLGRFPEYIVTFESGKARILGVLGNETKQLESPGVLGLVLGKPGWRGDLLRFPIRVGLTWSDRFQYQTRGMPTRWEEARYEVQGWEKIKTSKGEFDAFKLVMTMSGPAGPKGKGSSLRSSTYYYAPDIKAIVSFHETGTEISLASVLTDFNVVK